MKVSNQFKVVAALMTLTLLVGGAGLAFPWLELLLEWAALATLAWLALSKRPLRLNRISILAVALFAVVLLLPLLQLVPLPPSAWQQIPGRGLPTRLDALLGWTVFRPFTLDVEGTIRSWLRLLAPLALFLGCLLLTREERFKLLWVAVAVGSAAAVLGLLQFVTGGAFTPYPSAHLGYSLGFFVNRNHQAAFLAATLPLFAALTVQRTASSGKGILPLVQVVALALVVSISILATTSRMGLLLLLIAVAWTSWLVFGRDLPRRVALPAVSAVLLLTATVVFGGGVSRVISRFGFPNSRFDFWTDLHWALREYGFAGTGVGTFVPVFQSAESLDSLGSPIVNHAHNDFLEVLLETGFAGAALVAAFLLLMGYLTVAAFRQSRDRYVRDVRATAAVGSVILLIASSVDYPLRMPAVAGLLAVFVAALLPTRSGGGGLPAIADSRRAPRRRIWFLFRGAALLAIAGTAILALQAAASAAALLDGSFDEAAEWAPWSTQAQAALASRALTLGDMPKAASRARRAIRLSPINVAGIRTLGLIDLARGDHRGTGLMDLAASLGWRDPLTQMWAISAAEETNEPEKAFERAEALFKTDQLVAPGAIELLGAPPMAHMELRLAAALRKSPEWRASFFDALPQVALARTSSVEHVLALLAKTSAPATPDELKPTFQSLLANGLPVAAQRLWSAAEGPSLVANGDFEHSRSPDDGLPSYWQVDPGDLARVRIVEQPSSKNHVVRLLPSKGPAMLAQRTYLAPGQYTLSYDIRLENRPPAEIQWQFVCIGSGQQRLLDTRVNSASQFETLKLGFEVPRAGCESQWLALHKVAAMNSHAVLLDNISISPSGR